MPVFLFPSFIKLCLQKTLLSACLYNKLYAHSKDIALSILYVKLMELWRQNWQI